MSNQRWRWLIGVVAMIALALLLWLATRPPPLTVQGEVSAARVDVGPRVSGRVVALEADVGDAASQGALLARLESPQLAAALTAAEAALTVAKADLDRVSSTRPETIAARRADLAAAEADVTLYQLAYDRQAELATSGNTPLARRDEAARNLEAAARKKEAAEAALQLAIAGASAEERALAAAQVKQAEAALAQRQADVDELVVRAPIDGEVVTRIAELGENFSPGAPIFSLIDMSDVWFAFNLREDLLAGLRVGDQIEVRIPAIGGAPVSARVTLINAQGQYAAWRATRATGDFDLRSFEVRAKPTAPVEGLRPGMSAIADWSSRRR